MPYLLALCSWSLLPKKKVRPVLRSFPEQRRSEPSGALIASPNGPLHRCSQPQPRQFRLRGARAAHPAGALLLPARQRHLTGPSDVFFVDLRHGCGLPEAWLPGGVRPAR